MKQQGWSCLSRIACRGSQPSPPPNSCYHACIWDRMQEINHISKPVSPISGSWPHRTCEPVVAGGMGELHLSLCIESPDQPVAFVHHWPPGLPCYRAAPATWTWSTPPSAPPCISIGTATRSSTAAGRPWSGEADMGRARQPHIIVNRGNYRPVCLIARVWRCHCQVTKN